MCGRFVSSSPPDEIADYFDATAVGEPIAENYNVAPTDPVLVVYEVGNARRVEAFRWGLLPHWAKDLRAGARMINARSEGLASSSAFKGSLAGRRCIVPADGFYEWRREPGSKVKQPYFIHRADGEPMAFAGLWATWRGIVGGEQTTVHSATIITCDANETMSPLHDRMPVILPAAAWDRWLDPTVRDFEQVSGLLVPAPDRDIAFHPVSTEVNSVKNDGAHLVDEVAPTTLF